jgi:ribose transport system ATP-binding protein
VAPDAPVVLQVKNLKSSKVKDVSFELRKGEILGFAGLVGAGRTETMRLVYGADPKTSGEIFVKGKKVNIRHSKDAIANGIGYLSEDRKRFGLILGLSVTDNTVMASYDLAKLHKGIFVNEKNCEETANEYVRKLKTKTPSVKQLVKNLSGGNQQKAVLARWMLLTPQILILDEPTRGIDVGAKYEIYSLMEQMAQEGKAVIMISSEMPELLGMSDRIAVMCEGHLSGILDGKDATDEKVMYLASTYQKSGVTTDAN